MWVQKSLMLWILVNQLLEGHYAVTETDSVYVSHCNAIWKLSARTNETQREPELTVASDLPIQAFDIHRPWSQVFWATDFSIYRTPLYDLHSTTRIATTGRVGSLAVDWIYHHVYWTDLTEARIEAVHTDGTARRVVSEAGNSLWSIRAIALDPQIGKLFWIESIEEERREKVIKSCNFDGSRINIIHVDENIYEQSPLTLDVIRKNVYYYRVNGSYSEQWELNYGGIESKVKVYEKEEPPPRSFSLAKNGFFYSNKDGLIKGKWIKREITIVNGESVDTVNIFEPYFEVQAKSLSNASQLRVSSENEQPLWRNECQNQLCQQDCVPGEFSNASFKCLCHYGFLLQNDNRTCKEIGYVLFSTDEIFGRMDAYLGPPQAFLYNDSSSRIQAFDLHIKSNQIYWSDYLKGAMYRAPVELPTRKTVVMSNVSAYGVAVDWLYDHLYWTDDSRLMVSGLTGDHKMALLQNIDSPADLAVDPIQRFVFWAECGSIPKIRRAGLDGSDVSVIRHVTCGVCLMLDPKHRTLYWRNWEGEVFYCDYGGSGVYSVNFIGPVRSMTLLNNRVVYDPLEVNETNSPTRISMSQDYVKLMKVMKSPKYQIDEDLCVETDCPGLCLPSHDQSVPPKCLCPDGNNIASLCPSTDEVQRNPKAHGQIGDYLELVEATPFSIKMRCAGPLLRHPMLQPFLRATEVDSLVPRGQQVTKISRTVRVSDKTLPFTIDTLNPATSYRVTVMNRVTRAGFTLEVHTPPPPLTVRRLPMVSLPGEEFLVSWLQQAVHFFSPNVWEDLVHKEYFLLLVSKNNYTQTDAPSIPEAILTLIRKKVKHNFMILKHYQTDEDFDDDPTMYLGNIPWAEEFWLAMVQVTEYKKEFNLDVVLSRPFSLPDPFWNTLLQDILDQQ